MSVNGFQIRRGLRRWRAVEEGGISLESGAGAGHKWRIGMGQRLFAAMTFCGLWVWMAAAAEPRAARALIQGREHLDVTAWAARNRWQVTWERPGRQVRLRSGSQSLVFAADTQECRVNGVVVHLLRPSVARGGTIYVSAMDWEATLGPVVRPPRNERRVPVMRVCLDPGHGGRDPGNEEREHQEKQYTMLLARDVRSALTNAGLQVVMTRQTDSFVPLESRPEYARRRGADLFVSLHFNAAIAGKTSVRGVEVFCLPPAGAPSTYATAASETAAAPGNRTDAKNMVLAYEVQRSMVRGLPVEDRGVKRARFVVLRNATIPAVLVEAGFMSHPTESRRLFEAGYRRQLARAIADGILAYKRLVERS